MVKRLKDANLKDRAEAAAEAAEKAGAEIESRAATEDRVEEQSEEQPAEESKADAAEESKEEAAGESKAEAAEESKEEAADKPKAEAAENPGNVDPHRNYVLEQVEFDAVNSAALIKNHKDMSRLTTLMNAGMFIFIGGIFVQSIRMFLFKDKNIGTLMDTVSKIANIVIVLGIAVYMVFYLLERSYPVKKWKCPHCGEGLPFIKPVGKSFNVINQTTLHDIEERGIRIGHVGRSGFIIPEHCPKCDEKLLLLPQKKRLKKPKK